MSSVFTYGGSSSGAISVDLSVGAQQDAFGRLRTSQPYELFSKANEFDNQPLFYENTVTGSASQSYSTNTTSTTLSVSAASDIAIRTSRWYIRYRPGKSQQIFVTGNFDGAAANVTKRMGLFDDRDILAARTGDGVFFEVTGDGIFAVLRSSTSGSSVDTRVAQANWNGDKLDGSGASGVTLDLTKQQVAVFTFGWLGSAVIRFGFVIDGTPVICHTIYPSNLLTTVFMARPSLPIRWSITTSSSAGSMQATCASVQSEGGFNTQGVQRSVSMGGTPKTTTATTLVPLMTIRLKSAYRRGLVKPISFSTIGLGSSPESYEFLLLINASLTGATFATGSASEIVEYDTAATALSGGRILDTGYGFGGGGSTKGGSVSSPIASDVPVSSNYAGVQDTLTIAVRPLGTSSTSFYSSLTWTEFY